MRRLLACADRHGRRDAVIAALAKTRTLTRGPKPGKALKEIGLDPTMIASAPTSAGVIASLRSVDLHGVTVGVQLYSESNPPLEQFLREAGAAVATVQPYVYAPASDTERVGELIDQMAAGKVDAIVFTSAPQVDRLFAVAEERGATDRLMAGLAHAGRRRRAAGAREPAQSRRGGRRLPGAGLADEEPGAAIEEGAGQRAVISIA